MTTPNDASAWSPPERRRWALELAVQCCDMNNDAPSKDVAAEYLTIAGIFARWQLTGEEAGT